MRAALVDRLDQRRRGRGRRRCRRVTTQSTRARAASACAPPAPVSASDAHLDVAVELRRRSSSRSGDVRASTTSTLARGALRRSSCSCVEQPRRARPSTGSAWRGSRRAPESQRAVARVVGRDHADRDVPRRQVVLQPVEHAPAVDVGQVDVERDRRRACTRAPAPARRRPCERDQALEALARAPRPAGTRRTPGRSRRSAAPGRRAGSSSRSSSASLTRPRRPRRRRRSPAVASRRRALGAAAARGASARRRRSVAGTGARRGRARAPRDGRVALRQVQREGAALRRRAGQADLAAAAGARARG